MKIDGKVTVITGGASGIGAACARNFAARGAKIAIADLKYENAQKVAGEIGGIAIGCDVGKEAEINDLVAQVESELGPVDIFFNNAGVATGSDLLNTGINIWQQQWDLHVLAHVYATRAVLPGMLERGSGYFIHTASIAGYLSSLGNVPYAVTKHAIVGFAEFMSITYHDKGVHTSLLAPMSVQTAMLDNANPWFARNGAGAVKDADDVAEMVAQAVEEERFLILTDDLAQTYMDRKNNDIERWLNGMRRMQASMEKDIT